jgi:poly-beta-hydroxybutyrate-responsive repressor
MSSPESKRRRSRRAGASEQDQVSPEAGNSAEDTAPSQNSGQQGDSAQPANEAAAQENGAREGLFSWTFRDFLIPYILLSLSVQRAHGYVIEQYLRGLGLANIEMSTLYRTLRQLERDGLVCSTWEPGPEGPARRIYSLTDAGRWWLDAGASALAGYRSIIDRFFGNYSGPGRRPDDPTGKGD